MFCLLSGSKFAGYHNTIECEDSGSLFRIICQYRMPIECQIVSYLSIPSWRYHFWMTSNSYRHCFDKSSSTERGRYLLHLHYCSESLSNQTSYCHRWFWIRLKSVLIVQPNTLVDYNSFVCGWIKMTKRQLTEFI